MLTRHQSQLGGQWRSCSLVDASFYCISRRTLRNEAGYPSEQKVISFDQGANIHRFVAWRCLQRGEYLFVLAVWRLGSK